MSGFKKKDSGCQVRKNAAQRTANEEKNKRTLQDCGITVTKKGEDESPTASNSFLPSQSIQVVGTENDVTDISESSGEPLSKIGMVAVNEENILVLPTEEPIATIPSNDPALWAAHLSKVERDSVLLQGLPRNPSAFPKDSNKKKVPESIFYETSLNGEKTCRDWLVWSVSKKSFICFPCSLFGSKQSFGIGHQSHLLRWNDGISCNWHKLPEKVKSHQNNAQHRNFYIEWKTALESLENQSGIDAALENSIRNEAARWREILRCILDVTLFLASRNLSFRGSSKMIGEDDNGNFLATLELLAKHNKTLQLHLEEVSRCQQEGNKMNAHYLGWSTQNEQNGIDLKNCRGQGYDNGANMSGIYKGVQAIILQKNPQALYMPCSAHSLNLAGVHSAESSVEVKNYFGRVQSLYNLFSGSPSRWKVLIETTGLSLHQTSQTRWSARIEAVKPLVKRSREILESLKKLRDFDLTADQLNEVKSLEKWVHSFEFIVMTTFWYKTLQSINYVSLALQSENISLDDEMKLIKTLIEDLNRLRSSWTSILNEARLIASGLASFGFQSEFVKKRTKKRKTFHEEVRNTAHFHEDEAKEFEVSVFNTALDTLIQQVSDRFQAAEKTTNMFSFLWSLKSLVMSNEEESEESVEAPIQLEEKCKVLAQIYATDVEEEKLIEEVRHLDALKRSNLFGPKESLTSMTLLNGIYQKGLQPLFESVCILLRIFNTIPVSVAEGERSFSKLALVKTALRSTMSQERLTNLLVISIEHDLAKKLCYGEVISKFAMSKARKINFL